MEAEIQNRRIEGMRRQGRLHMKIRHQEINLQRRGMRRRKKEVRHMKIMTGLTVFFLAVTLLFQDNMNRYQMEMNYNNYGEWFMRQPAEVHQEEAPYQERCGEIWSGSTVYKSLPQDQEEEIEIDPSDTERYTGRILGTMDEGIIEAGHISLYEGKMPEKENEITMELNALQALGCDYDLGQEISFYLPEKENVVDLILEDQKMKLHRKTFTLVGTIKGYSNVWNGGEVLPGIIISETAFEKLDTEKKGYIFQKIRKEYAGNDICKFANKLLESTITKLDDNATDWSDMGYSFNENAYSNPFWSNRVMYRNMTIVLLLLGISIMAYLMSSYLSKRRKFYYQLREIGASVYQIGRMAGYECIWSTMWTAAAVLLVSYGVSVVIVFAVARAAGLPFFFVFRPGTLARIILCVSSILLVSMAFAMLFFLGKRITDNRNGIPGLARKRLKRRAEKRKAPITIKDVWKREAICHPFSTIFSRIVGILACLVVLSCLMQINERILVYHHICQVYRDFTITGSRTKRVIEDGTVAVKPYIDANGKKATELYFGETNDIYTMKNIFPEDMLQSIRELSGVKQADYSTRDQTHILSWEGKGSSEFYKHKIERKLGAVPDVSTESGKRIAEQLDEGLYGGWYFENSRRVWDELKIHLHNGIANYEDFKNGKQVVLLESDLEADWSGDSDEGVDRYIEKDDTIKEGDIVTIQTGGKEIRVEVAGVLSADEMTGYYGYGYSEYNIVGSDVLGKRIAAEDGIEYGYNRMELDFNALANSEATDKIITRICDKYDLEYDSGSEYIRSAVKKIVQAVLVYGTLAAIIFILYIFVLSCILQEESRKRKSKIAALHQLGISVYQLKSSRRGAGIREAASLLVSVPILYIVWSFKNRAEWDNDVVGYSSVFFNKTINCLDERSFIFYSIMDDINLWWVLIFMLVACGTVFLLHRIESSRK